MADQPKWRYIATDLCHLIILGEIPVGKPIPSLPRLRKAYGVSDHPVRSAVEWLKHRGILAGVNGVGIFVERIPATDDMAAIETETNPWMHRLSGLSDRVGELERSVSAFNQQVVQLSAAMNQFKNQVDEALNRHLRKGHTDE